MTNWETLTLSPEHRAMLMLSGVSAEVAAARGYYTAEHSDQMPECFSSAQRKRVPALVIPVWGVDTTQEPITYRMRPDEPLTDTRGKGKPRVLKYEQAKGAALRLDVPPSVQPQLSDPSVPLVLTEGEKKADAGASAGIVTVSLPGVWGFRGTDPTTGGKLELPDLDRIAWNARDVWLAFDSDVVENGQVQKALSRLSGILTRRGAVVHVLRLPATGTGTKQGLDDVLAAMPADSDKFAALIAYEDAAFWQSAEDNRSIAERLRDYILDEYELGQDEDGNGFALPRSGPRIVRMLYTGRPSLYSEAPVRFAQNDPAKPVVPQRVVSDVMAYIAGLCWDAPKTKLHLRVANYSDRMVIDVGNPSGALVHVGRDGWRICMSWELTEHFGEAPLFRRTDNLRELPLPEAGGSINELRALLNVTDETWPLVHGWLLGSLFSDVPVPWLFCTGPQGSGKSDAALFILNCVDPRPALQAPPRKGDRSDPAATAANSYLLGYDNMTSVSQEHSDWLCALVTGAVDERRILHTTASTQTLSIKRSGVLTGISVSGIRPDLAERLVTVDFDRITGQERKAHGGLTERFRASQGKILAALLDGISGVYRHLSEVDGDALDVPRMADYARVLRAYDLSSGSDLFGSYRRNVLDTFADHAEDDPVASVVLSYMQTVQDTGNEQIGALFDALTEHRDGMKLHEDAYWPSDARRFGRDVKGLVATLEGKVSVTLRRSNGVRLARMVLLDGNQTVPLTNGTDGSNGTANGTGIVAGQSVISSDSAVSAINFSVERNIESKDNKYVTDELLQLHTLGEPAATALTALNGTENDETAGQPTFLGSAVSSDEAPSVPLTFVPASNPVLHDPTTDRYGRHTPLGLLPRTARSVDSDADSV